MASGIGERHDRLADHSCKNNQASRTALIEAQRYSEVVVLKIVSCITEIRGQASNTRVSSPSHLSLTHTFIYRLLVVHRHRCHHLCHMSNCRLTQLGSTSHDLPSTRFPHCSTLIYVNFSYSAPKSLVNCCLSWRRDTIMSRLDICDLYHSLSSTRARPHSHLPC